MSLLSSARYCEHASSFYFISTMGQHLMLKENDKEQAKVLVSSQQLLILQLSNFLKTEVLVILYVQQRFGKKWN